MGVLPLNFREQADTEEHTQESERTFALLCSLDQLADRERPVPWFLEELLAFGIRTGIRIAEEMTNTAEHVLE